jgi:hypothetical protein
MDSSLDARDSTEGEASPRSCRIAPKPPCFHRGSGRRAQATECNPCPWDHRASGSNKDNTMVDAKLKWWERTAHARTKCGMGSADKPSAGTEEGGGFAAAVGHEVRPGAVAVRGPGRGDNDDDGGGGGIAARVGEAGRAPENDNEGGTTAGAPPFHVDWYAVHKGPNDEEIRQQILAGTARAEPVPIAAAKAGKQGL